MFVIRSWFSNTEHFLCEDGSYATDKKEAREFESAGDAFTHIADKGLVGAGEGEGTRPEVIVG